MYPSISSLISRSVATSKQGEVLGAINGVRALTEGFGPLLFSCLFWYTEDTFLPGCPYLIAAVVCLAALVLSYEVRLCVCVCVVVHLEKVHLCCLGFSLSLVPA